MKRWARHYDACVCCKKDDRRHVGYGVCATCHKRRQWQERNGKPLTDKRRCKPEGACACGGEKFIGELCSKCYNHEKYLRQRDKRLAWQREYWRSRNPASARLRKESPPKPPKPARHIKPKPRIGSLVATDEGAGVVLWVRNGQCKVMLADRDVVLDLGSVAA